MYSKCILDTSAHSTQTALAQIQSQTQHFGISVQTKVNTIQNLISYVCYLGYPSGAWLLFRISTGFDNNRLSQILSTAAVEPTSDAPVRDLKQRTLTEMWGPASKGGKKSKKYKKKPKRTRRHKKYTKKHKTHMKR
jgi:hypothetical protein